ncbi:DUF6528 family protein [Streptomyces sp. NPDC050504]|uniref:DUF6528 family protein n=1 Tax=Streptomyces sp. NPDC050504 TaxID=3365618 RepID=UPI00379C865D
MPGSGHPSRRTLVLGGAAAGLLGAGPAFAAAPRPPALLVTDQARKRILKLDSGRDVWDPEGDPGCVRWAFSPLGDPRYADLAPRESWVYPCEAKVRVHGKRTYLLTTASFGFAAVVEYPSGRRHWGAALSAGTIGHNPHSIELLPDGSVAVASSTGGSVRWYAAPPSKDFVDFALEDAHGLQWDPVHRLLWALGGHELVALRAGDGAGGRPALGRLFGVPLPTPYGHDLFQVAGRSRRLWVTTGAGVYQFDKRERGFRQDFPGADRISRADVKAVGDHPLTGQVASTVPRAGLPETWWTREVTVHRPDGVRVLKGGGIYKARWWAPR